MEWIKFNCSERRRLGRWVRFADSFLIANVRVFIFMMLRRIVGFVLGLLGAIDMLISRSG